MYTPTFLNGQAANMVREFVVDTVEDITSIDVSQLLPGSRVFVINTSQWYMLNHRKLWQTINWGSGGGGSGGSVVYDGGNIDDNSASDSGSGSGTSTNNTSYDGGQP